MHGAIVGLIFKSTQSYRAHSRFGAAGRDHPAPICQMPLGIRFVTIGTKTAHSERRIPFPADLLPYLPPRITDRLITGRMDSAGKRLGKWMEDIGIAGIAEADKAADLDKAPMHSFRHRAARRLRAIPDPSVVRRTDPPAHRTEAPDKFVCRCNKHSRIMTTGWTILRKGRQDAPRRATL
jgi:hypothetical protein